MLQTKSTHQDIYDAYVKAGRNGVPERFTGTFLHVSEVFRRLMRETPELFVQMLGSVWEREKGLQLKEGSIRRQETMLLNLPDSPCLFEASWRTEEGKVTCIRYQAACECTALSQILISVHASENASTWDECRHLTVFLKGRGKAKKTERDALEKWAPRVRNRRVDEGSGTGVADVIRLEKWSFEELKAQRMYFLVPFLAIRHEDRAYVERISRELWQDYRDRRLTAIQVRALTESMNRLFMCSLAPD